MKSLGRRLGYSTVSCTFASEVSERFSSPFTLLQNQILLCCCRYYLTSEISANQQQEEDDFTTVNYLIKSCGLSPEGAIKVSKRVKLQSPERPDSVLALFRNHGFSQTQISKLVRSCPQLVSADPKKTLLPKLEYFSSVGVSREALAKTLANNPVILAASLENQIIPTYNFLRSLISEKNAASVIKYGSRIFLQGHTKNVVPNIGILIGLGMPHSCISLLLAHFPGALMQKTEKFAKVVDKVKQLGFNLEKTTSVEAIRALCSSNSNSIWNRSRQVYMRYGWSEDEVVSASKKFPRCMVLSEKKIEQVMEFVVNKMGWPSGVIAKTPRVLSLSLEKRIIPRGLVIKVLLSKGLIEEIERLSLCSVFRSSEKYFLERFVARYIDEVPQLLSVYQGKVEVQDV